MGGLLDSFRIGAGHQKDHTVFRSLELSAPVVILQERGEGLAIELMIDHVYMVKLP